MLYPRTTSSTPETKKATDKINAKYCPRRISFGIWAWASISAATTFFSRSWRWDVSISQLATILSANPGLMRSYCSRIDGGGNGPSNRSVRIATLDRSLFCGSLFFDIGRDRNSLSQVASNFIQVATQRLLNRFGRPIHGPENLPVVRWGQAHHRPGSAQYVPHRDSHFFLQSLSKIVHHACTNGKIRQLLGGFAKHILHAHSKSTTLAILLNQTFATVVPQTLPPASGRRCGRCGARSPGIFWPGRRRWRR